MFGLGVSELIIIGVIIFLIFGARRLPEIGRGLGQAVKELKGVKKDLKSEDRGEKSSEKEEQENPDRKTGSESATIKGKIESIPGVEEIKTVKQTASEVRRWWRLLKH
jgi:sec-independent protein translocase protein TatA